MSQPVHEAGEVYSEELKIDITFPHVERQLLYDCAGIDVDDQNE